MELLVRSQDKTILSKFQNMIIRENQNENNETNYAIVDVYTMGIYSTKERALEILDEIQELIKPKIITTQYQCAIEDNKKTEFDLIMNPVKTEIQELSTIVYEMPKE